MKTIIFHGLLKKLFCKQISLRVFKFKDIFSSLAANYNDYEKKLNKIRKECLGFVVLVDGDLFYKDFDEIDCEIENAKCIELIPCCKFKIFGSLVAVLISIGLSTLLANIVSFLLTALILFGISFLISKLFGPKGPGNPIKTASYIFSNKDNIAARNTALSLNYGRLRLGSNVTNAFILNFDLTSDFDLNSISQNTSSGLSSAFI